MSGSNTVPQSYEGQPGVYGTLGVPSTNNTPGARANAVSWIDSSGNLWLFGGVGYYSGGGGQFNDLWEFNPSAKTWTWLSGSITETANGVYGTLGVPSTSNVPGGRFAAVSWIDRNGKLWLFGGQGTASSASGNLGDLWKFNPANMEWAWISGSNSPNIGGVYGTLETASVSNAPGARYGTVSWIDSSGNFWLFGGYGDAADISEGDLNDLWMFNPTSLEWTWISGSNTEGAGGVYGTEGVPAASNVPRARDGAVSWIDSSGNLWLFGGESIASSENGTLNDLWKFDPTSLAWTWMSGSNPNVAGVDPPSVYGSQGMPSSSNTPGGREGSVSWTDGSGNLWLFGGANIPSLQTGANLNDMWEFNPTEGTWTWISGGSTTSLSAVYGMLGEPSSSNTPGGREGSVSWTDGSGSLWLFGGVAPSSPGTYGYLNDLWRYQP